MRGDKKDQRSTQSSGQSKVASNSSNRSNTVDNNTLQKRYVSSDNNPNNRTAGNTPHIETSSPLAKDTSSNSNSNSNQPVSVAAKIVSETDDHATTEYASLFVKNLNFKSTEASLRQHANRLGCGDSQGLRAVSFPKKVSGGVSLSMGFGFLEYVSSASAQHAFYCLHGSVLDGHALEVKPSDKRITAVPQHTVSKSADNSESCKLLVRNVAFQATKKELRALFSAFGAVKSVRIPKKMGGQHRGFAFIELSSVQEAMAAKSALSSTHLYGRHLVIECATDDDLSLDVLRKRATSDQVTINQERKRSKLSNILDDNNDGILAFGKE